MDILTQLSGNAILFAVLYGLVKIIEALVKKTGKKESILLEDERMWLQNLYTMHQQKDSNGIPVWYVPRGCADAQDRLLDKINQISTSQEKISFVLESILKHIEHLETMKK